jgi:FKBP-type peptidyl-prolyl cis-trans isomerase 2
MSTAKVGDTVAVHYTGRLDDGSVFDTSEQRDPLRVTLGENRVIPGFEKALVGMEEGESKQVTIPPDAAYGPRRPEMVLEIDRGNVPPDMNPQVGQELQLRTQDGQPVPARVVEVSDQIIKVDANHPLAGQQLTFDLRLVEISTAS